MDCTDVADDERAYISHIEQLRTIELPDCGTSLNLDAAGCPPAPRSVLDAVHADLTSGARLSNPHSDSPSGRYTRRRIDGVRSLVCQELFGVERRGGPVSSSKTAAAADAVYEDQVGWELAFSSGTTASIQTVARSFTFGRQGRLAYFEQSHSSLYGIRDIVVKERNGAGVDALGQEQDVLRWLHSASELDGNSLMALPLQCNATGKRFHPLIRQVLNARRALERRRTGRRRNVFLLLDAASYLSPSSRMQMTSTSDSESSEQQCHEADFVCFSFLKVLGYPSGLGGLLIMRRSAHALTDKQYYGGGALEASTARTSWRKPARELHEALEDGTLHLYGIVAVETALLTTRSASMLGSWHASAIYVDRLTVRLWRALHSLKHGDGSAMCEIYSDEPHSWTDDDDTSGARLSQGPILLFNILRPAFGDTADQTLPARRIDPVEVDRLACLEDIHLRTGRMCNIGAITTALGLCDDDIKALWERGIGCGGNLNQTSSVCAPSAAAAQEEGRLRALVSGAIRVSLCAWNTERDIERLVAFVRKYFWVDAVDAAYDEVDDFVSCKEEMDDGDQVVLSDDEDCDDEEHSSMFSHATVNSSSGDSSVLDHASPSTEGALILKEAYIYPIKSCAAQRILEPWKVTEAGLEFDRGFCVVDLCSGKVLSQKRLPAMARIRPVIHLETGVMEVKFFNEENAEVDRVSVALNGDESEQQHEHSLSRRRQYDMCGTAVEPTLLTDKTLQAAFSAFLGRQCTLASGTRCLADGVPLRMSNESPFLMITAESVRQVCDWIRQDDASSDASRLHQHNVTPERVSMAFRANFVVGVDDCVAARKNDDSLPSHRKFYSQQPSSQSHIPPPFTQNEATPLKRPTTPSSCAAFYEDVAQQVRIGTHASFTVLGPCRRCEMIALDAVTGQRAPYVFSAVARHRRCRQGSMKGRILFGQHLIRRSCGERNNDDSSDLPYIVPGMSVTIKRGSATDSGT